MRISITLFALALAGLASAQNLEGLPTCAQSCVTDFTSGSSIGGCPGLDIGCICRSDDFLNNIACCLASKCDTADQATAVTYAKQICKTAPGGGVTVPDEVVCKSASSTSSTSSASSTATATTSSTGASAATTTSSSASASATPNSGLQNSAGTGMGIAGGLAAVLALL